MVRLHRDRLRPRVPDTELTRRLGGLAENRRRLVDERTRFVNQLHSTLKAYYPLAETLLGAQMNQPLAAEFLLRWPDLESLQKTDPQGVRRFFFKHHSRSAQKIQQRLDTLATAKARPPIRPSSCPRKEELWADVYYHQHRARNQEKHHQACRALAFKLIRIQFACWRSLRNMIRRPIRFHGWRRPLPKVEG